MANELKTCKLQIVMDNEVNRNETINSAIFDLEAELEKIDITPVISQSYDEAELLIENDMDIDGFLISSDMDLRPVEESKAIILMKKIRARRGEAPIFIMADRSISSEHISFKIMELANEFVWIFEDSPVFIAGRIDGALKRYHNQLMPPLFKAIYDYNENYHEYSWAAPGHQGGVGFTKSPIGKKFYDFYSENLFRTDTGIERESIGSLLDHSGSFGESEKMAAKVFGADQSYSVVVGTSGSNRTVMQSCLAGGDIALCDRNCHKSIEQGLILTGAIPIYMKPTRNRYGIIGPIHRSEMTPEAIAKKIKDNPLHGKKNEAAYSVVTNCTYDGICYNAEKVENELDKSVDRIHFDEAWYAYARFNPMYKDHFAMRGDPEKHKGATVFATHSTHKLLCALSQASYIHVRNGRRPISFDHFNQSYMLHATTSPLYAICASNDIATGMMKQSGESLTTEVIAEAVDFRQALARTAREMEKNKSWFFTPWNVEQISVKSSQKVYDFADAPRGLLIKEQKYWNLEPGKKWHGFENLEDNWAMLDPIKVSILTPGMGVDGKVKKWGVPAELVSAYLYYEGMIPTRTTDFQLMFLFSIGITKGKWGSLLNALLNFKKYYDANTPVAEVLPHLAKNFPSTYGRMGLRDLGDKMFDYISRENPTQKLDAAFADLPQIELAPRSAFMKIVNDEVELVSSSNLAGRISANSLIPYPPGIPLIMSGEKFGSLNSPQIQYLKALEKYDKNFPGFEHVTEGADSIDGEYQIMCVKN